RSHAQIRGFEILENVVMSTFGSFFCFGNGMPTRRLIHNDSAVYHGMAVCQKIKHPVCNGTGNLAVRNEITSIYLKSSVFRYDGFYDAL
ncbi:MAG: hypothetical protein IKS66_00725, partial [Oscillospiraceae bacterium]|nr:hypothetical protein [Oscillospiraceae bacterium]